MRYALSWRSLDEAREILRQLVAQLAADVLHGIGRWELHVRNMRNAASGILLDDQKTAKGVVVTIYRIDSYYADR